MTINFYLPRYKSKSPEQTIFCRIYQNKKELNLNTDCKIKPEFWDKDKQRANVRKAKSTLQKSVLSNLNKILEAYEGKVNDVVNEYKSKNVSATFNEIINALNSHFNKKEDVNIHTAFKEFIIKREKGYSDGQDEGIKYRTVQKYQRLQRLLFDFEKHKKKKINFVDIDMNFLSEVFKYMVYELKFLNDTAFKNIQYLKTFLTYCFDAKYISSNEYKKFGSKRNQKSKGKQNEVIFLTSEELMTLYKLEIKNEKLERVKDVFCFQCFTGQRYGDIENIARNQIKNNEWHVRTEKTEDKISVPLDNYAQSILEKYKDFEKPLPVISNQKMNKYVKELCELAGFDETIITSRKRGNEWIEKVQPKYLYIGTHTARRTFVTVKINNGWTAEQIMKVTGHSDYKMVKKYFDILSVTIKDKMKEDEQIMRELEKKIEEEKRQQLTAINFNKI